MKRHIITPILLPAILCLTSAVQAKELEDAKFGIWPLLRGTLRVTLIAMTIALPLGLVTAIFLSEFASPRLFAGSS